jgi:hypothetical protein
MTEEENKIYLPLDLPPDLYDWICEEAAAHQRTFEEHIVFLCEAYLDEIGETGDSERPAENA